MTCVAAGESAAVQCNVGWSLQDGACEPSCSGHSCEGNSICVDGSDTPVPSCVCIPGYYSRLATEPAPRAIPEGWSEGPAPPPPPPAPARIVLTTPSPPPPPLVFMNETQAAPRTLPPMDTLGGFSPFCTDGTDQPVANCAPEDVKYVYFMPITQEARLDTMKANFESTLIQQLWIDSQTREVEVEFVVYNGNMQLFAIVLVTFKFDTAGGVSSSTSVTCLDLEVNGRKSAWSFYHLLELATLIYVVVNGFGELKDLYDAWKYHGSVFAYFTSIWNYFDLAQVAVFAFCAIYWIRLFLVMSEIEISNRFDWSDADVSAAQQVTLDRDCARADLAGDKCSPRNLLIELIDKIHEADGYFLVYKVCTIINLYLSLVRVFKYARFQAQLSMVNRTLSMASEGLLHFCLMLGLVMWVTAAQLKLIYGRELQQATTYIESINLSFQMALGAYPEEAADLKDHDGIPWYFCALYFCAYDNSCMYTPCLNRIGVAKRT